MGSQGVTYIFVQCILIFVFRFFLSCGCGRRATSLNDYKTSRRFSSQATVSPANTDLPSSQCGPKELPSPQYVPNITLTQHNNVTFSISSPTAIRSNSSEEPLLSPPLRREHPECFRTRSLPPTHPDDGTLGDTSESSSTFRTDGLNRTRIENVKEGIKRKISQSKLMGRKQSSTSGCEMDGSLSITSNNDTSFNSLNNSTFYSNDTSFSLRELNQSSTCVGEMGSLHSVPSDNSLSTISSNSSVWSMESHNLEPSRLRKVSKTEKDTLIFHNLDVDKQIISEPNNAIGSNPTSRNVGNQSHSVYEIIPEHHSTHENPL